MHEDSNHHTKIIVTIRKKGSNSDDHNNGSKAAAVSLQVKQDPAALLHEVELRRGKSERIGLR